MIVKNSITTVVPVIPCELESKLVILATYKITEFEARLFSLALQAIVKQLKKEGKNFHEIPRTNAIITKNGAVELEMDKNIVGSHVSLVIYNVEEWRRLNLVDYQIIMIYLEELCHNYWNIEDEIIVKHKVHEIIQWIVPDIKFEELYNLESLH